MKYDIETLSDIMAKCVQQERDIDKAIEYLEACDYFLPNIDELTNEGLDKLKIITDYHNYQHKRLVITKEKINEQFKFAQKEYMNLIEQAKKESEKIKEQQRLDEEHKQSLIDRCRSCRWFKEDKCVAGWIEPFKMERCLVYEEREIDNKVMRGHRLTDNEAKEMRMREIDNALTRSEKAGANIKPLEEVVE